MNRKLKVYVLVILLTLSMGCGIRRIDLLEAQTRKVEAIAQSDMTSEDKKAAIEEVEKTTVELSKEQGDVELGTLDKIAKFSPTFFAFVLNGIAAVKGVW